MKFLAYFTLLVTAASGFAPPTQKCSTTAVSATLDGEWGTTIELQGKCPPLGSKLLEDAGPDGLKWFQNSELKHGRVAMIATIGYLVQSLGVHFPLYLGPSGSNVFSPASTSAWYLSQSQGITFSDVSAAATPLDAIQMVPAVGWAQVIAAAAMFEATAFNRQWVEGREIPGDYGYDPLGFTKREGGWDSTELTKLREKELKNGRLAMITIAGWVSEDVIPGSFPVWHP